MLYFWVNPKRLHHYFFGRDKHPFFQIIMHESQIIISCLLSFPVRETEKRTCIWRQVASVTRHSLRFRKPGLRRILRERGRMGEKRTVTARFLQWTRALGHGLICPQSFYSSSSSCLWSFSLCSVAVCLLLSCCVRKAQVRQHFLFTVDRIVYAHVFHIRQIE